MSSPFFVIRPGKLIVAAPAGPGGAICGIIGRDGKEIRVTSYDGYFSVSAAWNAEFERARKLHGAKIHCGKGCCECCSQMFRITEIEAAYISAGVKQLPEGRRVELRAKAREYQARREELLACNQLSDEWDTPHHPGLRLPCPALENGACSIYEHRPMICRKYGIPLFNPRKPERIFACELNFKPGEEVADPDLVQIHTALHERWEDVQSRFNEQGGKRDPKPLTVARAILEDFECYLPEGPA